MHKCLQTDTDAQPYLLVFMMKSSIYELKGNYVQSFFEYFSSVCLKRKPQVTRHSTILFKLAITL